MNSFGIQEEMNTIPDYKSIPISMKGTVKVEVIFIHFAGKRYFNNIYEELTLVALFIIGNKNFNYVSLLQF